MNADEILLSLDKNYRKCPVCKKYYHDKKNRRLHRLCIGAENYSICFLCNWLHGSIRREMEKKTITIDDLQIFLPSYIVEWEEKEGEFIRYATKDHDAPHIL